MAKRKKGKPKVYELDVLEGYEEPFEDDLDLKAWFRDLHAKRRYDDFEPEERFSARRKIERRNDIKKLYSQLDEWEEFGSRYDY